MKVKLFTIIFLLLVLVFPLSAYADKGVIVPWDDVVLSEPGQKAFIAHNGQEELLILSTDVKASRSVSILEFMPLPSRPEVSLAQEDCFTSLKELVSKYNLHYPPVYRIMSDEEKGGVAPSHAPVELIFHQKLGVHDVTAVKINDLAGFASWVKDYFKKNKIPYRKLNQKEKNILTDYFNRGFKYFVFDLVKVEEGVRTVPPLIYRFKCDYFYYPLKVTNLFGGMGKIELICYADEIILKKLTSYLKTAKLINAPEVTSEIWPPPSLWLASTKAGVGAAEIKEISPVIPEITGNKAYLQAFKYEGSLEFKNDLWMKVLPEVIKVFINNSLIIFDVSPILYRGCCLVPARGVFESLGAKVCWDGVKKEVTIKKEKLNLVLSIYQNYAFVNGVKVPLNVPARLVDGRTMIPLRFISEAMGAKVEWDKQNNLVRIVAPIIPGTS